MRDDKNLTTPNSLNDLMNIYKDYEDKSKTEEKDYYTVDFLQYLSFKKNPITDFHNNYFSTKYKVSYNWISKLFLLLGVVFSLFYFLGYFIDIFFLHSSFPFTNFLILYVGILLLSILAALIFCRMTNKWNWKSYAIIFSLFIALEFIILRTVGIFEGKVSSIFNFFYTVSGASWAPACIIVFIFAKKHKYITDYGGIHLFLGWIYRVSETQGNFEVLTTSFYRLINELENWLKESLNVIIKNKEEIYAGFYLNLISNKDFLKDIYINNQKNFQAIFQGLFVEDILNSKTFSQYEKNEKRILSLDLFNLKWLSLRLAIQQLPNIIQLTENLSSKRVEIQYLALNEKLKKYKTKIISLTIFTLGTIFPLIFTFIK